MAKEKPSFMEMLEGRWKKSNSLVCVGLDTDPEKMPESQKHQYRIPEENFFAFNRHIIDTTHDLVCAYKPQFAFYGAVFGAGERVLKRTIGYIHSEYPDIPVILDAKRNDIGNTAEMYVEEVFNKFGADAVTINPYLGKDACQPFLDRKEKGIIVLCKTSNPGAGEFQDLLMDLPDGSKLPLYQIVAKNVAEKWNDNGNCALVVGATYPEDLKKIRILVGDMPILVPGIGKQGGDVEATVKAGLDSKGTGMIINSSRGIIYASDGEDFADAARAKTQALRDEINKYR